MTETTAVVNLTSDALAGNDVTAAYTTADFDTKDVANGKTVTVNGISISGADAANYTLANTSATATADITAIALTVSATADDKAYDGNTTAVVNLTSDALAGNDVTAAYTTADFDTKDVANGKTVTVNGISISGADAANYTLANTSATATADITAIALTVSATADDKAYDGNTTAVVNLTSDALAGNDVTAAYTTADFDTKDVANGKTVTVNGISISGADAANYTLANTSATATADITAIALTVSATADDKAYDGNTTAVVNLTSDALAGNDVTAAYTTADFDTKDVANGKTVTVNGISISGADAANYTLANTSATATADITAIALTVSATADDKAYDGNTTAVVNLTSDALAGNDVTAAYTTADFDTKDVANGKTVTVNGISISGADAANYTLANTSATATADITAIALTVSATADDKAYDGKHNSSCKSYIRCSSR